MNIIWLGGESLFFSPMLFYSHDGGFTWHEILLFQHGVFGDNAVFSIAFDPIDINTVYVGIQGSIIKTEDGGQTWIVPFLTSYNRGIFSAIEFNPQNENNFWVSTGRTIMETSSGGKLWGDIKSPRDFWVYDMG